MTREGFEPVTSGSTSAILFMVQDHGTPSVSPYAKKKVVLKRKKGGNQGGIRTRYLWDTSSMKNLLHITVAIEVDHSSFTNVRNMSIKVKIKC
jgi:hypothetical protein